MDCSATIFDQLAKDSVLSHRMRMITTRVVADAATAQEFAKKLAGSFSLKERDSAGVDQKQLSNLQKVIKASTRLEQAGGTSRVSSLCFQGPFCAC